MLFNINNSYSAPFNLPVSWVLNSTGQTIDYNNNGYPDYADNVLNATFSGTSEDSNNLGGELPSYYLNYDNMDSGTIDDGYISSASNWNTAFGWGDHSTEGYLTTESDPQWLTDKPNYYTITQVYTQAETDNLLENLKKPTRDNTVNTVATAINQFPIV